MARYGERNYRIGVDVGNRSVGLSAVEFGEDGMPVSILRAVSFRHDGGLDPTTNKTPKSRKETAGVARRVRRMRKRRAQRLKALDGVLAKNGFPIIDVSHGETYECWTARVRAVESFVEDPSERFELISRSARHIARHRGWRNPWLSWKAFTELETPTPNHVKNIESLNAKLGTALDTTATLGQMALAAAQTNRVFRPRGQQNRKSDPIIEAQVQQVDQYAELARILKTQQIESRAAEEILRAVFDQVRPYVPDQNIGRDVLPGMRDFRRASRSSLAFQEFRIRATVANLRVRGDKRGEVFSLNHEDRQSVVDYLINWREEESPNWSDIADLMFIPVNKLVTPTFEDSLLKLAPTDKTSRDFEQRITSSARKKLLAPVKEFWDEASIDLRELLIEFITSPNDDVYEMADAAGLSDIMNRWSDEVKDALMGMQFESGRAAYSLESLRRLNNQMATAPVDLHEARKLEFGVDDSWRPPLPSLDERTGQPAVDRVLVIVRRFVMGAVDKWGLPQSIVVEHAREGFMGASARDEYLKEISSRTARHHATRNLLIEQGIERPTRADTMRYECIRRQRNQCGYCGTEIVPKTSELDHIVPRVGGGSNTRDNLIAVCRRCNHSKGSLPFAVWVEMAHVDFTSMTETLARVRNFDWQRSESRIKNRMLQRLKRKEGDPEIDERSIASTAYAAVEVRARLVEYLSRFTDKVEMQRVEVYTGGVSREARRSGQIDDRIRIRGKAEKDRFDVRHHAIDASVMTLLNPSVALTLEERSLRRRSAEYDPSLDPDKTWREYSGRSVKAQEKYVLWRQQSHKLADLLVDAIANDAIPVAQQLRLGPSRGAIHKDTVIPLAHKPLGSAWSREELLRVVEHEIYGLLRGQASAKLELEEDSTRTLVLADGRVVAPTDTVEMFAKAAASIKVNGGSVEIGEQIHHARVYRWTNRKGEFEFGILRVFAAELPWLQKQAGSRDLLTMAIDRRSMSYRDLQPTVMAKIESGEATEVGWVTVNDELVLDVERLKQGTDKLAHFLRIYPESRWKLDGTPSSRQFRIRPLLLSREGSTNNDVVIAEILEKGSIVGSNGVLQVTEAVVRRDGLGGARWTKDRVALPVSWRPNARLED